ncbi:MAG: hypothetical protein KDA96_22870, partial [Planctomycetaceae bacterium]|nr:hypothetical protein [Planctomycetaceae bacterium]
MSESANVTSIDAIRVFAAAVLQFQTEARLCLTTIDTQLRYALNWLEHDRPMFWKREIEACMREISQARVRLHQCRMRRLGDFRPSCIEEQKDLEQAKKDMEFAQKQVPNVKRWYSEVLHEANEYRGRSAQLVQAVERDIPQLLAILRFTINQLEAYADTIVSDGPQDGNRLAKLAEEIQTLIDAGNLPVDAQPSGLNGNNDQISEEPTEVPPPSP